MMPIIKRLHAAIGRLKRQTAVKTEVPRLDFEQLLQNYYEELDLHNAVAIDVGAHTGRHTVPLAACVGKEGIVMAFEPVPTLRHELQANCLAAGLINVEVLPFALSNSEGIAEFSFVPNLPEEGGLKERKQYNAVPSSIEKFEVAVKLLDHLVSDNVDVRFIKIDVEGAELDVLRGAAGVIERHRPVVAFEAGASAFLSYHDQPELIYQFFTERDYDVFSIHRKKIGSESEFRKAAYEQNFWDYVAVPRAHSP